MQAEEEEETDQEHESPLIRRKRVIVSISDLVQDETTAREVEEELISTESRSQIEEIEKEIEKEQTIPIQRRKKRKMTVSPSNFTEDSDSETIAMAIEKRKKVTVSVTNLVEDTIHEAAAKAVE